MFCIKCGKPAAAGNFCSRCYLEREKLFALDNFTLHVCPVCGKGKGDIDEAIESAIKTSHRITDCKIKKRAAGNRIYADVACTGFIRPLKNSLTNQKRIIIFLKKRKCENCIKLSGGYYEAVIQARGSGTEKIMRKLKILPRDSVARMDKLKEGYDIRLIDKKTAAAAVKHLRKYFNVKESYKLVGEKKGKKLYRNYYAVR